MNDYIKREDAIKTLQGWKIPGEMILATVPTADVVEVVRCKDCKYLDKGENDSESWCECTAHFGKYFDVNENDFCSYGKREDT